MQGSRQVQVTETMESRFKERVDTDEKGKGKAKEEEKDALPNRVEQLGSINGEMPTRRTLWTI
jgi:hypothetical protein